MLPKLNYTTALNTNSTVLKPTAQHFNLPEKVLQFGTGVLLRGLPDYYIDNANKKDIFNGRIVVVKSTGNALDTEFAHQDNLYTHVIKGVQNNVLVEKNIINASISRVLTAKHQWKEIIETAKNEHMQLIISNTTEVGIVLDETDNIVSTPPTSFPGKLLAWLYARYIHFSGSVNAGVTIVPTELVTDNGTKLKLIVQQLAQKNNLSKEFISWLLNANDFCNSLVDRIVPGKLPIEEHNATENALGYKDDLMIMSEVYSLWAIESTNEKTKSILSFANVNEGVVITESINKFRELKLRLLNGTHTFSCGLAYLAGFTTVKEAMGNKLFSLYLQDLMTTEIAPCIESVEISRLETYEFSKAVIDRFRNPYINHQWLSITMNYTGKMQMRNIPLIQKHYQINSSVPEYMAAGFAAYILFMKPQVEKDKQWYGELMGKSYVINDDKAAVFADLWKNYSLQEVVQKVLGNLQWWQTDLNLFAGFTHAVVYYIELFEKGKILEVLEILSNKNKNVTV